MSQDALKPWAAFHGCGKWTKERPTKPGVYPVATREGDPVGLRTLVMRDPEGPRPRLAEAGVPDGEPGWQGWWWSYPLPPMPRVEAQW